MSISASIVLYKTDSSVLKAIECLLLSDSFSEIYLVDNSPTDVLRNELVMVIEKPAFTYIFNNANLGFGAGHNIAIKKSMDAGYHYHLVLNPDVSFETDVVNCLLRYMETNKEVGLVQPKIFYPNGQLQYNCKLLPTPVDLIFKRFIPNRLIKKRLDRFQLKDFSYNQEVDIPYLSGCFMLLRTNALRTVGLFDERFFMYPEDIDLTRRMHQQYRTVFYPQVHIVHVHEQGSYKSIRLLYIHITNMIKYFNKWGWFFDKERKQVNKKIMEQFK